MRTCSICGSQLYAFHTGDKCTSCLKGIQLAVMEGIPALEAYLAKVSAFEEYVESHQESGEDLSPCDNSATAR